MSDWGQLPSRRGALTLGEHGHLYSCGSCGLWFRRPYPSGAELARLYSRMPASSWTYAGERFDEKFARELLGRRIEEGAVLDCGCFRGDFLASLPNSLLKYGIEPSGEARQVATGRGIRLLASSIDTLPAKAGPFHGMTLLDVIEHVPEPLEALATLAGALAPGGMLIISTGNTDALTWRLMRKDYWYYYPEHVSFFNPGWFRWAAPRLGLVVTRVARFSHFEGPVSKRWRQCLRALGFWAAQKAKHWPRLQRLLSLHHAFRWQEAPFTGSWSDHMVVVLEPRGRGLQVGSATHDQREPASPAPSVRRRAMAT